MKKSNLEFKVGVFVMLSLVILGYLVIKAGSLNLKPGYTVRLIFDSVSGIDTGTTVRLAGVPVGEVKNIQVVRSPEGRTEVEVTAWITQGALIEDDAEIRINSIGLLGEKYIEITPGTTGNKTLAAGSVVAGKTPVNIEKITESGDRLIKKLEYAADNINHVIADPAFQSSVKGTFSNAEHTFNDADAAMSDFKEVSADLKDAAKSARIVMGRLRDGEGTVGRLMKDDTIARDLEAFVADIKAHPWKLLKRG